MKISIDTSTDSHDHIKHVIALLQNVVGTPVSQIPTNMPAEEKPENPGYVNIFAENPSTPAEPEPAKSSETPFFNMFADNPKPAEPTQPETPAVSTINQYNDVPENNLQKPTVQTTTPERAPPQTAPPEVDMFGFFNKAREKKESLRPY